MRTFLQFGFLLLLITFGAGSRDYVHAADASNTSKATFAGGCFWCMQPAFEGLPGVISTTVGYTGGQKVNPTYEEVSEGGTGHAESIEITFDPTKTTYRKLLNVFWHNVDPTTRDREFCDTGHPRSLGTMKWKV